jgi:hypothetical protein
MTIRIPYEIMAFEAERILMQGLLGTNDDLLEAYERYVDYIEACGWTEREFDEETLKRVDHNWDTNSQAN